MAQKGLTSYFFIFVFCVGIIIMVFMIAVNRRHLQIRSLNKIEIYKDHPSNASKTVRKEEPVLILFWSLFFGNQVPCDKPIPISVLCNNTDIKRCNAPCEITTNRSRAASASVIIIHARDPYPLPPPEYSHIPLVLFTWENPIYTPTLSNPDYVSKFTYLMSYRPDLADFFLPTFNTPKVEPKPIPFENKTGLIAAVFSNCETVRTAYLKELMKTIQVDSYGSCLKNKEGLQARYKGEFKDAKTRLLRNYKFTIVFLNQDCDYFVDDQLTHALSAGTIPVYMGTDKVDYLLGGNLKSSIIRVRDFESPRKLADYLLMLSENKTMYNRYLRWKYEGFQFPQSFLSTPQGKGMNFVLLPQYCDMCATMAASRHSGNFKQKGLVKPEYCRARKLEDWLPKTSTLP